MIQQVQDVVTIYQWFLFYLVRTIRELSRFTPTEIFLLVHCICVACLCNVIEIIACFKHNLLSCLCANIVYLASKMDCLIYKRVFLLPVIWGVFICILVFPHLFMEKIEFWNHLQVLAGFFHHVVLVLVCSHPGLWMSFKTNKHKFVSGERCLAFKLANKRDMLAIRHTNQLHSHYHHHHDITGIGTIRNKNNINLKSAIPVPKPFSNNFDKKTIKPPLRTCSFFQGWMLRKTVIVTGKGKGMNWWGNKHETFKKGHVFLIERV